MVQIANLGFEEAMHQVPELLSSVNTHDGHITYKAVAKAHGLLFQELKVT